MNQGFKLAQQASEGLQRPYQGEIEQARVAYMERGEIPSPELVSVMSQDIKEYEQQTKSQGAYASVSL